MSKKNSAPEDKFIYDNECFSEIARHMSHWFKQIDRGNLDAYMGIKLSDFEIVDGEQFLEVKYNDAVYQVTITKIKGVCHWYLKPFRDSYFTCPSKDINSFDTVIQAIKEHDELIPRKKA